ncbi:MAG TPA: 30S ribosomal protein S6 [Firmicutes bacterium]|nr:30S ribosomal protein S6 [Bacillota bacterium]
MAKVTERYESLVVFSTKLGEDGIKAMVEKFTELISSNGTLENVDEWGKRRLAYEINYETEGYYVLFNFTSAPAFPAELDRIYKITDGVIRSMIVTRV